MGLIRPPIPLRFLMLNLMQHHFQMEDGVVQVYANKESKIPVEFIISLQSIASCIQSG